VRARIFEPFFTTWNDRGGTGLGLAVVKSIVTEHRGTIEVDSKREEGTRFTVRFPVARAAQVEAAS
jgi:signal transduction histidine kinase